MSANYTDINTKDIPLTPATRCPDCGAPVLPQSSGDVIAGLWQYECCSIGGHEVDRSCECLMSELSRYRRALETIFLTPCATLEQALEIAHLALVRFN
jgi:hypothetical protein